MRTILSLFLLASKATASLNLTALYSGLSPAAEIIYTTDPDFNETTPRYTIYRPPASYGTIIPATEADIQHIVRTSVEHNIPFLATGGGHGITKTLGDFQYTDTGITIELSKFNTVELSPDNEYITVGGGARYEAAYEPMYNAGKMMAMGNSPCVGIVGAALGGAVGMWQGLYGLGIDSLVSVRLVTAAGELVSVSASENEDLFWAIRGAGANFGIVTEATFRLHEVFNGGDVAMSFFRYHAARNGSVWRALRGFDDDMPDLLAFNVAMTIDLESREPVIAVQANYYGPISSAEPYLQPFHDAGPFNVQQMTLPWPDLQSYMHTVDPRNCAPGQYMNEWSISLRNTDVDAYVEYYNQLHVLWASEGRYTGQSGIARFPTRLTREVGDGETAYPHRRATSHLYEYLYLNTALAEANVFRLFENFYSDPELDGSINVWMADVMDLFQETSGFDELHVYSNFAQGNGGAEAWYGRNLDRLKRLKRVWDPNGLFNYNNPIPV